jgi:hypothetical protein
MGSESNADKENARHGYYLSLNKQADGRYRHRIGRPLSPLAVKEHEAYYTAGHIIAARKFGKLTGDMETLAGICAESLAGRPESEIYRESREDIMAAEALLNRIDLEAIAGKVVTVIYKKRRGVEKLAKALIRLDKQAQKPYQLEIPFKKY